MAARIVVGIDLSGAEDNRSGFCVFKEEFGQKDIRSRGIFQDKEILEEIEILKPNLVAIDAPLTSKKTDREADKEMKKYGALPISVPGMQMLAKRGLALKKKIESLGVEVIEIFPRATEKIMGLDRNSLSKSAHQGDAILAAMTGFWHLEGKTKEAGDKDGKIIIPKPSRKKPLSSES